MAACRLCKAIDLTEPEPRSFPDPLVVKNGSKALASTAGVMPVPESLTVIIT
jgi:hypothetical protein